MDLIFFLVIAIFVGYRLFTVLGRKDFDPNNLEKLMEQRRNAIIESTAEEVAPAAPSALEDVSNYSPEIVKGIQAIKKHDSSFTVEGFISGAKTAFEWILRSYSTGDLETLKQLVNDEELEEFRKAIEAKEKKKQKEEIVIVSEPEVTIESIEVKRSKARIKTTIISEQIDFIQDKKGAVVEGDQSQVDQITDIWVFEKNLKSSDPNWILVETEIAN